MFCSKRQYRRFLLGGGVDEMHWRYVFKHPLININDFYVRLRLQKNTLISGFDTTSMFFRHHLQVFLMEVVSKKVQIKKARAPVQNARVLWLGRSSLNFFQTQMSETGLAGL